LAAWLRKREAELESERLALGAATRRDLKGLVLLCALIALLSLLSMVLQ
jgi:hypothetical protein